MAVFCSSFISYFSGMLLRYFLNYFETLWVALTITVIAFVVTFHLFCICIVKSLYFRIFSVSFLMIFLSPEIATSIITRVPSLLSRIMMSGFLIRMVMSVIIIIYYYYHYLYLYLLYTGYSLICLQDKPGPWGIHCCSYCFVLLPIQCMVHFSLIPTLVLMVFYIIIIIITYYILVHVLALLGHLQGGPTTTGRMYRTLACIITRKCSYSV